MENHNELISVLQEIKEENKRQQTLLERQCRLTRNLGLLFLCLVAAVVISLATLLPRAVSTLNELNVVVSNTQEITEQLKDANIEGTINNLEAIDIETLNRAINDLYQVINPLASLFSRD